MEAELWGYSYERKMIYLETGSTDPHFNLAFEEYILRFRTEGDYLILWQNADSVIIGCNQNAYEEVDLEYLTENHIALVRRKTGGGAVFHDLGNLNFSFITDKKSENQSFKEFTKPVVAALRKLGLDASAGGRNDILIEGKKVSGTAMRIEKDRILHHGTLLFSSSPEKISRALRVDSAKFESKAVKSVRSRVGLISDFLSDDKKMTLREFWDYILAELMGDAGAPAENLDLAETEAVKGVMAERYGLREWNFGRSPEFSLKNKRRFPGGTIEVHLSARAGAIEEIAFYGDFLSKRDVNEVCKVFSEKRPALENENEIIILLNNLQNPLEEYFGGIEAKEIAQTILGIGESKPR